MTIKTDPGIPAKKHKGQLHRYCHTQTNQYQYASLERMRTYANAIAPHFFSSIQTSKVQFKSRAWVLKGIGSSGMYRGRPGFPGSYFRKVSSCLDHMGISIHAEGELKLPYGGLTMCFGFLVSDRGQTKPIVYIISEQECGTM
jgi:hypothetical protein